MTKRQEIVVKRTGFISARPHLVPCIIAAAMLLGALGKWPYGYYRLLRWVVCAAAVFTAWNSCEWRKFWGVWLFGIIAFVFNPLVPFHLARGTWQVIDVASVFAFVGSVAILNRLVSAKEVDTNRN